MYLCLFKVIQSASGLEDRKLAARQQQGMDRPGVCQVPEGSGEQGKMQETGCQIICGVPTTLTVKGYMG